MAMDVPSSHEWTVAESNWRLVHNEWPSSSAASAGAVYPCIAIPPAQPSSSLLGSSQPQAYIRTGGESGDFSEYNGASSSQPHESRGRPGSNLEAQLVPAAWHPHKASVAVVDSLDRVLVFDMAGFEKPSKNGASAPAFAVDQACLTLAHALQTQVCALAWRPHSGSVLAVGCRGGVVLWCTSGSSRAPVAGSRPAEGSAAAAAGRSGGGGSGHGPWLTFLAAPRASSSALLTDLAWSPDGQLLAAASPNCSGLLVWHVASGALTRVAAGFSSLRLLRWSPSATHLFAASHGSKLYLFETGRWRYQSWDSADGLLPLPLPGMTDHGAAAAGEGQAPATALGRALRALSVLLFGSRGAGAAAARLGRLSGVQWAPSSQLLLMSFSHSTQLLALHVVGDAAALQAQLMPVALPDLAAEGNGDRAGAVVSFAWDARGERLGVLLGGQHPAAGCVALFATAYEPVVSARLLGFARPPPAAERSTPAGAWSLSAHACFQRGSLFTLRMSEALLYNLPMLR